MMQLSKLPENVILVAFREQFNINLLNKWLVFFVSWSHVLLSLEVSELPDEGFTF